MDCVYFNKIDALKIVLDHIVERKLINIAQTDQIDTTKLAQLGVVRAFHLSIKLMDKLSMLIFLEHQQLVKPLLEEIFQNQTAVDLSINVQNI